MPITLIAKAEPSTDPILMAAEKMEPDVAHAFIEAAAAAKSKIDVKALAAALQANDPAAAYEVLKDVEADFAAALEGAGIPASSKSFKETIQETFAAGAAAAVTTLPKTVTTNLRFDMMNPEAVTHLNLYTFSLIQQVTEDQRDAIRQIVTRAFKEGGHPFQQAREIREVIGLTARQEQAVANYRAALEGGNYQQALDRALRDGRYDRSLLSAIQNDKLIPQERVDAMVTRYRERYVQYRSETIARTETARASNAGTLELHRQAVKQGLLNPSTAMKVSIASGDDRTCDQCLDIESDTDDEPIPIEQEFIPGCLYPPYHVDCRCTYGLRFKEEEDEEAA